MTRFSNDPEDLSLLRDRLLAWYAREKRELPWRSDPSPYKVWLSEIMLQQTRVATVLPYFNRFIATFPKVESLANASVDDVLTMWSGLGYYSRARNLHKAAQFVFGRWGGKFPQDTSLLQEMPGVGRYTAGAIASIAFGVRAPIVDGNVIRVLSRLIDLEDNVGAAATKQRIWDLATALVDPEDPGAFNQGIMDLGATICTPRAPQCPLCPWRGPCRARAAGTVLERPVKTAKRPPKKIALVACVIHDDERNLLLTQRPIGGLFGGLWEVPMKETSSARQSCDAREMVLAGTGLSVDITRRCGSVRHLLTHRDMDIVVYEGHTPGYAPPLSLSHYTDSLWLHDARGLDNLGVGRVTRKILEAAETGSESS
jgi:A/G-specific adenine glycosylase